MKTGLGSRDSLPPAVEVSPKPSFAFPLVDVRQFILVYANEEACLEPRPAGEELPSAIVGSFI